MFGIFEKSSRACFGRNQQGSNERELVLVSLANSDFDGRQNPYTTMSFYFLFVSSLPVTPNFALRFERLEWTRVPAGSL
jgi:hypothetical protein